MGKEVADDDRAAVNRRFRALRLRLEGPRGKSAFARRIGESQSNVSRWETGRTIPGFALAKVVQAYNVNPHWLLTGEGEVFAGKAEDIRRSEVRVVAAGERPSEGASPAQPYLPSDDELSDFFVLPLLRDAAAAGPGREIREEDIEGPAIIHRRWCPHPEQTDYVRVSGDSMEPVIPDDAIVTIDKAQTDPEALLGRVVAVFIAQTRSVTIKRLQRDDVNRNRYVAVPDNLTLDNRPHVLDPGDRIIGRVLSVHALVR